MDSTKQPTCAERVEEAYRSRLEDLERLWKARTDPDGAGPLYQTQEHRARCNDASIICESCAEGFGFDPSDADWLNWIEADRPSSCDECGADWPDEDGALYDLGSLHEYGLAFDYVAPETFPDQKEGYFRYQISYGGPSEEFRFFTSGPEHTVYRVEFWFLDWWDGAPRDCTDNPTLAEWFDNMRELGCLDAEYQKAAE